MNGSTKWLLAGALAASFGFAATYSPEVETTGYIAGLGGNADRVVIVGLQHNPNAFDEKGYPVATDFNVEALNLQPGKELEGSVDDPHFYKITTRESLLRRMERVLLNDQTPRVAQTFQVVRAP